MLHEFRQYSIKPGQLPAYVRAFDELARPVIDRYLHLLGFWTSDIGELNKVHHLWAFEDHDMRLRRYAALRADPDYVEKFLPIALPLIERMHSTILYPAAMTPAPPLFAAQPAWRPLP